MSEKLDTLESHVRDAEKLRKDGWFVPAYVLKTWLEEKRNLAAALAKAEEKASMAHGAITKIGIKLAETEARCQRLQGYADSLEDDLYNFHPEHPPWGYSLLIEQRREDAGIQTGDVLWDGELPESEASNEAE